MTEETDMEIQGLSWDKPHFHLNGKIFIPKIYEIKELHEPIPKDYNTVSIQLDGRVSSYLNWDAMDTAAQKYREQGLLLFWNLDLGLSHHLKAPLPNQTQFLSLMLSLEHLRDTLWKKFKDYTLGVSLYCGTVHFHQQLNWDESLQQNYLTWGQKALGENFDANNASYKILFARDAIAEYLMLLANRMPDAMQLFAILDREGSMALTLEAQLTHRERFDRLHLIVRKGRLPTLFAYEPSTIGVCLPNYNLVDPIFYEGLEDALANLLAKKIPFRVIPEVFLMNEWEDLNYLFVVSKGLSVQGKRKLLGFCAAGGTVVTLGSLIGLPNEIPYNSWKVPSCPCPHPITHKNNSTQRRNDRETQRIPT